MHMTTYLRRGTPVLWMLLLLSAALCARADDYRLAPGDAINVTVVNHGNFGGTVTLMQDGTVILPVVGQQKLTGLTLAEATQQLTQAYAKRLVAPELYVTLSAQRLVQVFIVGAVKTAGSYPLKPNMGVFELIIAADGLTQDAAACRGTLIRKATAERVPVDLAAVLAKLPGANLPLAEGDTLLVEAMPKPQVYVGGNAVKTPGLYQITGQMGVFEALLAADGLTVTSAECQGVLVRKGTKERTPLEVTALLAGDAAANLAVGDGDTVLFEPLPRLHILVTGEVETPGVYDLPQDARLSQAIMQARGLKGTATDLRVLITRDAKVIVIDADTVLTQGTEADLPLQQGDKITVESALLTITVTGEVMTPGTYTLKRGLRLPDLITAAGGAKASARLSSVAVTHSDGSQDIVNLVTAKPDALSALRPGDRVNVPSLLVNITVTGAVNLPTTYRVASNLYLSELLALVGEAKPDAALSNIRLVHLDGTAEVLDARMPFEKSPPLNLRDEDRVIVPYMTAQVAVLGNVKQSGYLKMDEKHPYKVSEAIMQAGGLQEKSDTKHIEVRRYRTKETITIAFTNGLQVADPKLDVVLEPNDAVFVKRSTWSLREFLGQLAFIKVLVPWW